MTALEDINYSYKCFVETDIEDYLCPDEKEEVLDMNGNERRAKVIKNIMDNHIGSSWVEFETILRLAFDRGYMAGLAQGARTIANKGIR